MASAALVAWKPAIAAPAVASARFGPKSSSSVAAVTMTADRPGAEIRKKAVALLVSASGAAAKTTGWNALQFEGLNVKAAPLFTVTFVFPQKKAVFTTRLLGGRLRRRMKSRPSPASRTSRVSALSSGVGYSYATPQERTTGTAAFQSVDPACEAATDTRPVPVNQRLVPSEIRAGPAATANVTGRPLEAVADNVTTFVFHWSASGGKSIVWKPFSTTRLPPARPCQLTSFTLPVTA